MRFTHLRVENWRNFTQIDESLAARSFLVGPNASGKSNLLEVFRFLHDIVSVGGGFQKAVEDRLGVSHIRCLAARANSRIVIDVELGRNGKGAGPNWRYKIAFGQDTRRRPILHQEEVWKDGRILLSRPQDPDRNDPDRLRQTFLEQVNANREFREVAGFLSTIRYLHLVPQLLREPDRSAGRRNDPYGGDFLEQIARTPKRTSESRLKKIGAALRIAVPQLDRLEVWKDGKGKPHLRGLYRHWRPNAGWQTEEEFSDGTLRLLGLLWAALDGSGPLLLEEPELSLHTEVIRHIPRMLASIQRVSGRQVFVSTHSSDLLSDEGIGVEEVLLLTPSPEGTKVVAADSDDQIRALLAGGATVAEAVIPRTRPQDARQLSLFGS